MTRNRTPKYGARNNRLKIENESNEERKNIFKIIFVRNFSISILCSLFFLLTITACHNDADNDDNLYAPFLLTRSGTIDSLIEVMTLDEKLGQLIFVETNVSRDNSLLDLSELVEQKQISGVLLSSNFGEDSLYFPFINSLQAKMSIPLLIGLAPDNYYESLLPSYNLSAIAEDSIKHQIIKNNQAKYSNYQYDIAFDVDLRAIIQQNPNLKDAFFEKQQTNVFANSDFITKTYQSNGILTGINSCIDFKMNYQPNDYYSKNTYLPYQNAAKSGASLIYLNSETFTLDTLKSLEPNAVRQFLIDSLDFRGLSFTHAGDANHIQEQFRTGIDAFIVKEMEVDNVLKTLKFTFEKGLVSQNQLDESVKKILMAKDWTSRFEKNEFPEKKNFKDFEREWSFQNLISEYSTTVIRDDNNLLPFKEKANQKCF